jgi:hypothetical protein
MTAEVYKWRYGFGQTERLNFIKRVKCGEAHIQFLQNVGCPTRSGPPYEIRYR